jgi:hypothetical protein
MSTSEPDPPDLSDREDLPPPVPPVAGVSSVGEDAFRVEFRTEDLVARAPARRNGTSCGPSGRCVP